MRVIPIYNDEELGRTARKYLMYKLTDTVAITNRPPRPLSQVLTEGLIQEEGFKAVHNA